MKKSRRLAITLVAIVALMSFLATSVSAKNVCSRIWGSSTDSMATTFEITTGKAWLGGRSVVLSQSKGKANVMEINRLGYTGKTKTQKKYGVFNIKITDMSNGYTETQTWNATSTYNLKKVNKKNLKKNTTYKITITPNNWKMQNLNPLFVDWADRGACWEIKKTKDIKLCS